MPTPGSLTRTTARVPAPLPCRIEEPDEVDGECLGTSPVGGGDQVEDAAPLFVLVNVLYLVTSETLRSAK